MVYFIEHELLALAPGIEDKAEVYLFHAGTAGNSRASTKVAGVKF